ncbi:hypothetical protein BS47DRAFT_626587 [Hydnum rufescens UP504]|uniref:Uncharacterized protein n=1 Tax=Hydnum rufescens UP504 TaxID=1448309 RepID=A0A9P6B2V4_9AGAM|nr:hypothetical protein BS47DRAFT_626587 [Hydnum rufescens UP504]
MRAKVSSLAETCNKLAAERAKLVRDRESLTIDRDSFNAERKRASMYDTASSVALQQLHSRVGSLDAGRALLQEQLDAAQRVAQLSAQEKEQAIISRDEAMETKEDAIEALAASEKARDEAEAEAMKWRERVEVMEMESSQAADLLNSFHFTPAKGRSAANSRVQSTYSLLTVRSALSPCKANIPSW